MQDDNGAWETYEFILSKELKPKGQIPWLNNDCKLIEINGEIVSVEEPRS
jgi:hypothetical protein